MLFKLSALFLSASFLLPLEALSQVTLKPSYQRFRTFLSEGSPRVPQLLPKYQNLFSKIDVTAVATGIGGETWVGTPRGLYRLDPKAEPRDRVQYFASKRYLPDDYVESLLPDGRNIWVKTKTGVAHIEFKLMTLEEKADLYERRVSERHDRWGMVADSVLKVPGDLSSNLMVSNDNDGLWTAMYAAAECFRFSATKSHDALARAKKATEAVLFLTEVTGRKGFPARSYIKQGEPKPKDGFWYKTADGKIEWKADTSSDEIVGHFLIFALAHDLLPDEPLKQKIRKTARDIMDHILENKLYLVDVTGKPTRWGKWSPEYFATEMGKPDAPLNAAELLMFLKVTHHLTGDPKYDAEYRRVAWDMKYAELTTKYLELQEELNYSDEELALLSFYPLFLYEKDEKLLKLYRAGLDQWWKNIQREANPLWTFIYAVANPAKKVDLEGAVWTLHRIPNDLVRWSVTNSHRTGVTPADDKDRHGRAEILELLPADERPVMKWNGNPFVVDSRTNGTSEDDGAFFLLPYWMGRHHGLLIGR